jgi:hypothetical protein
MTEAGIDSNCKEADKITRTQKCPIDQPCRISGYELFGSDIMKTTMTSAANTMSLFGRRTIPVAMLFAGSGDNMREAVPRNALWVYGISRYGFPPI